MIRKNSELFTFWIIDSKKGRILDGDDDYKQIKKKAQEWSDRLRARVDIVKYIGSLYSEE